MAFANFTDQKSNSAANKKHFQFTTYSYLASYLKRGAADIEVKEKIWRANELTFGVWIAR